MRRPILAANWKMQKTTGDAVAFADAFLPLVADATAEVVLAPPFTALEGLGKVLVGFSSGEILAKWVGEFLDEGLPYGFYEPFLREVVLEQPSIFAWLVTYGELLGGACLTVGLLTRPAAAGCFLVLLNVSLTEGFVLWQGSSGRCRFP